MNDQKRFDWQIGVRRLTWVCWRVNRRLKKWGVITKAFSSIERWHTSSKARQMAAIAVSSLVHSLIGWATQLVPDWYPTGARLVPAWVPVGLWFYRRNFSRQTYCWPLHLLSFSPFTTQTEAHIPTQAKATMFIILCMAVVEFGFLNGNCGPL